MVLKAIIYEHSKFQGRSQELIPGNYKMASLRIPNDSLSSLKVEPGLKVTLYEHNFSGRSKTFTATADWVGNDFNDITSSVKVEEVVPPQSLPKAIIYEHGNFQGRSQELIPGSYKMASLGIPNDSLSSLKVKKGLKVTLYEHEFSGRSKTFTADASWVGDDFNDITSSVEVEELAPPQSLPKAIIYEHGNFQGRSQELIPGSYKMASLRIPNDSLSSLKVEPGLKVTLYEHNFSGRSKTFTADASWVGDDFNDITSSVEVEELAPPPSTKKFEVPGTLEAGIEFTNNQSTEVSYTFTPSGTWTPDVNNPSLSGCTAAGIKVYPPAIQKGILDVVPGGLGQYMKYPNNTPFALLAINKATGAIVEVPAATTISLKPGETLVFVLNDMWGGYGDNSGTIAVNC